MDRIFPNSRDPWTPEKRELQRAFLARAGDLRPFLALLDQLPSAAFFLKDEQSRLLWVSSSLGDLISPADHSRAIGSTDHDFYPKYVADSFVADDKIVLRTGQPIIGRVEIHFNLLHELVWSVTTKFPVLDVAGKVIGVVGFVTDLSSRELGPIADARIKGAIHYIETHCRESVGVDEIAAAAKVSSRQLLRLFRQSLGISVQKFAMKVKIQAAADALLQPHATVAGVSGAFGFCDQSAFTNQFRRHTGQTPAAFQRQYGTE